MSLSAAETRTEWIGRRPPAVQWTILIALSAVLGGILLWLQAPAALMLGPLAAAMVLASFGSKVRFPLRPFVFSQGIVGCLIAKMVPLSILSDIASHWASHRANHRI